jgi:hypothetical protein
MGLNELRTKMFFWYFVKFSGADTKLWSLCDMKEPLCGCIYIVDIVSCNLYTMEFYLKNYSVSSDSKIFVV